ncbi:GH3 auxin-responsive promoter family protein, partial [Candidatus Bathyarchaeota archaeon]|nr:GH3 auxin-responsive promoter family protein [Candidatus Bathyarchaeota archaeon]
APWIFSLYSQVPKVADGRAYWSISPRNRIQKKHGIIRVGFDRDSAYLSAISRKLFSYISVEPNNAILLDDMAEFRNQTLACLLAAKDLSLVSVWSPSFLRILLDWYFEHDNEIFNLMTKIYPKVARHRISELKGLGKVQTVFEKVWPKLKVISCWTDATSQNEALRLKKYFPNTYMQGKGLVATEAFVSLPYIAECDPVLAITSHFFEFMGEDGDCLLAHQVQKGCSYSVIVTTGGGFYRYRLEDKVLVTGFIGYTPTLRFLGKTENISDRYGEKVNSLHVARIIKSILKQDDFSFCMLAPDSRADKQFYTLYVESKVPLPERIANSLEDKLRENYNYKYCVELGQLEPARIFRIAKDGYKTYEARCVERGQKQGNIKLTYLSTLDRWSDYFQGDYK